MKKITAWLNKLAGWFNKHPVCEHAVLMLLDIWVLISLATDMATRPFAASPAIFIVDILLVVMWGGFLCDHIYKIIGIYAGAWNCMNITNPQIIQLIIELAKAQDDINSGKLNWKAAFYDPSKYVVEVTRVPLEEYLVDNTTDEHAVADEHQPTVDEKAPE